MADIVERLRVRAINPSREITFADGSKVVIESLPARDALLEEAAAEIERLRGLLKECANDLAAEIEHRYDRMKDHPAMMPKYERDMEPVTRARAALSPEQKGD